MANLLLEHFFYNPLGTEAAFAGRPGLVAASNYDTGLLFVAGPYGNTWAARKVNYSVGAYPWYNGWMRWGFAAPATDTIYLGFASLGANSGNVDVRMVIDDEDGNPLASVGVGNGRVTVVAGTDLAYSPDNAGRLLTGGSVFAPTTGGGGNTYCQLQGDDTVWYWTHFAITLGPTNSVVMSADNGTVASWVGFDAPAGSPRGLTMTAADLFGCINGIPTEVSSLYVNDGSGPAPWNSTAPNFHAEVVPLQDSGGGTLPATAVPGWDLVTLNGGTRCTAPVGEDVVFGPRQTVINTAYHSVHRASGKWYFEVRQLTAIDSSPFNIMVGVAPVSKVWASNDGVANNWAEGAAAVRPGDLVYATNGGPNGNNYVIHPDGISGDVFHGPTTSGLVIRFCLDADAGLLWAAIGEGPWNGAYYNGDPAAGTGGLDLTATGAGPGPWRIVVGNWFGTDQGAGIVGQAAAIRLGLRSGLLDFEPPAGYSPWSDGWLPQTAGAALSQQSAASGSGVLGATAGATDLLAVSAPLPSSDDILAVALVVQADAPGATGAAAPVAVSAGATAAGPPSQGASVLFMPVDPGTGGQWTRTGLTGAAYGYTTV